MLRIIEPIIGFLLGFIVLVDVFLLVLHARANTGTISRLISYPAWRVLVWFSQFMGRWKNSFLSFTGPIVLILLLAVWLLLLSLATALVIHPNLGTAVKALSGETPTSFITALYVGVNSLSFTGSNDFSPQTEVFRLFYVLSSLIGMSMVPLIITYLLEVYASLRVRNTLGLKTHLYSARTGDAAEIIAALGPHGRFDTGYPVLLEWATETSEVKESHHFHPILFYFRFSEPYYSASQTALLALDAVSLIKSALDNHEYEWLKESAAVEQLQLSTMSELKTLISGFIPNADLENAPDEQTRERWRRRYAMGVERIRRAGIKTTESGEAEYVALRSEWDRYITLLAPKFGFELDEVDTALAKVK